MKRASILVAVILISIVAYAAYKNHYHMLLKPGGAIMAASDVSYSIAGYFGDERMWKGVTPEIGFFLLKNIVNLSEESKWGTGTWLTFCLNQYQNNYENDDPERVKRIYKIAQYLIDSGIDVNKRTNNNDFTALEGAILFADFKMFTFLVKNGANVSDRMSVKGREGLSLLEFAKQLQVNSQEEVKTKELERIIKYIEQKNITKHSTSTLVPRAS